MKFQCSGGRRFYGNGYLAGLAMMIQMIPNLIILVGGTQDLVLQKEIPEWPTKIKGFKNFYIPNNTFPFKI
jgi:hypothetical protein